LVLVVLLAVVSDFALALALLLVFFAFALALVFVEPVSAAAFVSVSDFVAPVAGVAGVAGVVGVAFAVSPLAGEAGVAGVAGVAFTASLFEGDVVCAAARPAVAEIATTARIDSIFLMSNSRNWYMPVRQHSNGWSRRWVDSTSAAAIGGG
jgi:hypothetical protein